MSARAAIHAMFPLGEAATAELDRRLDAHRVENREEAADWLAAYPFPADTTDWARGRGDAIAWAVGILRNPNPRRPEPGEQAAFFQVGHTYTREHHGQLIEFRVTAIDTSPDREQRLARGWRTDEYSDWSPTDSDDLTGWTDVTEAGGDRD